MDPDEAERIIEGWARQVCARMQEAPLVRQALAERTLLLGRAFGLAEAELRLLRWGILLYNIGKMRLPIALCEKLARNGRLTPEQFEVLKQYPACSHRMLAPLSFIRGAALDVPSSACERWNGSGFPNGLPGEAIPLAARLFAVAHLYQMMTTCRPNRAPLPEAKARDVLREEAGKTLDPQAVQTFQKQAYSST